MPDDVAQEKIRALLVLGAEVESVRPASIVDRKQVCTTIISKGEDLFDSFFYQYVVSPKHAMPCY